MLQPLFVQVKVLEMFHVFKATKVHVGNHEIHYDRREKSFRNLLDPEAAGGQQERQVWRWVKWFAMSFYADLQLLQVMAPNTDSKSIRSITDVINVRNRLEYNLMIQDALYTLE